MTERDDIFKKTGGKCSYCGEDLTNKRWHVDHMIPVRRNISNNSKMDYPELDCFENKFPACASCNIAKHTLSVESFRDEVSKTIRRLQRDNSNYRKAVRFGMVVENTDKIVFYFEKLGIPPFESDKYSIYLDENDTIGGVHVVKCPSCNKLQETTFENQTMKTPCCNTILYIKCLSKN